MTKSPDAKHWILRALAYLVGLTVSAAGVAVSIRSDLGVSPVNSIPYVLSRALDVDIGLTTCGVFLVMILLQVIILRRDFKLISLLQVGTAVLFSLDVSVMTKVLSFMPEPADYWIQILYLLLSIALFGVGLFIYLAAKFPANPPDSLLSAIQQKLPKAKFSTLKVINDLSLTAIAAAVSLIAFGGLVGVREGTFISAVCIGFMMRLSDRAFGSELRGLLYPKTDEEETVNG